MGADSFIVLDGVSKHFGAVRAAGDSITVAAGSQVVVAIRPEKLRLVFDKPETNANTVEGRMGPAAYLGDRSYYYVHIRERDDPVAVAATNIERGSGHHHQPDRTLWLTWSADAVVLVRPE